MVKDAIVTLKERNGSSRQAIQKYIKANNDLGSISDAMFKSLVNRAIVSGEEKGAFSRPKGESPSSSRPMYRDLVDASSVVCLSTFKHHHALLARATLTAIRPLWNREARQEGG
ncbi:hypothetical protein P280DRAFT_468878 [Massarina eburnea CBS 473.64]|uniref:Histone H1 n=1 Tax=Massarina eburnea CBS 473.64 TaxID=1395130 RepID=A0A6A6S079_9PLEO|nr:hypothetical protein P280DRAFT_468878 [Massarina eburnea CBS 473.64]